jgi:hypothetical protein
MSDVNTESNDRVADLPTELPLEKPGTERELEELRQAESSRARIEETAREERRLVSLGYPPSLAKATIDPFAYALRLRTGETIHFSEAVELSEGWVRLRKEGLGTKDDLQASSADALPYPFPQGLEVRVADIVWCAESPNGNLDSRTS